MLDNESKMDIPEFISGGGRYLIFFFIGSEHDKDVRHQFPAHHVIDAPEQVPLDIAEFMHPHGAFRSHAQDAVLDVMGRAVTREMAAGKFLPMFPNFRLFQIHAERGRPYHFGKDIRNMLGFIFSQVDHPQYGNDAHLPG